MKRKIYDKLLEWKRVSNGRTPVMLDGARHVGKSWIVEEFTRNEYEAYLLIDFAKVSSKVKRYFNEYLEDARQGVCASRKGCEREGWRGPSSALHGSVDRITT